MQQYHIDFYDGDRISVDWLTKSTQSDNPEATFDDLMMLIVYILRVSYDINNSQFTEDLSQLMTMLGTASDKEVIQFMTQDSASYKFVLPSKQKVIKSFHLQLKNDGVYRFKYTTKGFGLFARGITYHALLSINALIRYLLLKNVLQYYYFRGFQYALNLVGVQLRQDIKLSEIMATGGNIFEKTIKHILENTRRAASST